MPARLPLRLRRALALAGLALLAATGPASGADPKVLNIYNWSDYIADDTIKNFEKETGIKVNYDNYDTNEVLHAKLVAGQTGYDIVVPGAHFAKTQIEGGLLQKLDRSKLSNWNNLDPALLKQLANVDPGNQYLVDWLWGYVTVGINVPKVKAALGDLPMPDNAWSLIFDPKYASKLKGCGVNFLDSASEVLPVALLYVGKPAYSTNAADYDAAAKMLAVGASVRDAVLVVGLHQRPGRRLALRGDGLFRRHQHRPCPRARGQPEAAGGDRGAHPQGRRDAVLRFDGDPEGREERRQCAPLHQLHPAPGGLGGADQQGLLRQPERRLAEVREEGRRRATRRSSCPTPTRRG